MRKLALLCGTGIVLIATSTFAADQPRVADFNASGKVDVGKLCLQSFTFNIFTRKVLDAEFDCDKPGLTGEINLDRDPKEKIIDAVGHVVDNRIDHAATRALDLLKRHGLVIKGKPFAPLKAE